jgi:cell wall-associated NlpC family hydrolase
MTKTTWRARTRMLWAAAATVAVFSTGSVHAAAAPATAPSPVPWLAIDAALTRSEAAHARARYELISAADAEWVRRDTEADSLDEAATIFDRRASTLTSAIVWLRRASLTRPVPKATIEHAAASRAAGLVLLHYGIHHAGITALDYAAERGAVLYPTPDQPTFDTFGFRVAAETSEQAAAFRRLADMIRLDNGVRPSVEDAAIEAYAAGVVAGDALSKLADAVAGPLGADAAALTWAWASISDTRFAVVATALAQLGKRYEFARTGPDTFDCSGFTTFAWRHAGVELPAWSYGQHDLLGSVPESQIVAGDLVFWDRRNAPDWSGPPGHVAMFLGVENLIVEASGGAGGVRVSRYTTPYLSGFSHVPLDGE